MSQPDAINVQLAKDAVQTLETEAENSEDELEGEALWRAAGILRQRYGLGLDDLTH